MTDGQATRTRFERWREGVTGGYSAPPADDQRAPAPEPSSDRSLATLGLSVVAIVLLSIVGNFFAVVVIAAVIAGVVMLHELGHFIAAKVGGMKVTEFFLGFGPRLWSIRRGETEYGVKAIPAGGYCRIVGMNNLEQVDPADEPRAYRNATFPRRFAVGVAGSTVHFVLAIVAVWVVLAFSGTGRPINSVGELAVVNGSPSPAQAAGFRPGDRIVAYDGRRDPSWGHLHVYIEHHLGKPIAFTVLRRGQVLTLTATPGDASSIVAAETGDPVSTDHVGFLGIAPGTADYSLLASVPHALRTFWDDGVVATFRGIGDVFGPRGLTSLGNQVVANPRATSGSEANRPVSVIGIVEIANQMPGWANKLMLFFIANSFVGMLNLFPILPFDGGHVVIAVYERIRSRRGSRYRADINKMVPYAMAMMVLIAFVMLSTIYLDIAHPITLH